MKTTFGRNKSLRAKNIQYKKLTADDNYRLPVFSIPNKMKLKILFLSALTILIATTSMAQDLADEVDLFMGVHGNSNCVIGPQLPHGSVNPSPDTPKGGQNGYDESDKIRGFSQLHVSGIGWSRYGQILLSPQNGFSAKETGHDSPKANEIAKPYRYAVTLTRYGIRTELSPTHHGVFYRFTFNKPNNNNILLDLRHNIPQDIVPIVKGTFNGGEINYNEKQRLISGYGIYAGGFGSKQPYRVYFAMKIDDPDATVTITNNDTKALYAKIGVKAKTVNAIIAISMSSVRNATKYLEVELEDHSFEQVCDAARKQWNRTLGKIVFSGANKEQRQLFYTSLYHSYVMPRLRTGDNPGWKSNEPHLDDHYCVWDTWRTKYPLMTLLNPSFTAATVRSFIDRYKHDGLCTATYTASMEWPENQGGDDVDNVIADAILKGVKGFDYKQAYEVMKNNALTQRDSTYRRLGWIPGEHKMMSCSYTLEYAYNDDRVAVIAERMGDTETAEMLKKRSLGWMNMFNPDLESDGFKGFIAPRKKNGEWISIDPKYKWGSWVDYFYEGSSWTYSLFVPSQFGKLIRMCGGKEVMTDRLRHGFDNDLIDLSNEPGFLSPFIFSHCDRPDLSAHYVNHIRKNMFSQKGGYPDNEDSGAMGSWYVFTSLGLFPNAGQNMYYLLPPAYDDITVTMENGKKIQIHVNRTSADARFISSVLLNGQKLDRSWISHDEIVNGAVIEYTLSNNGELWQLKPFEASRHEALPYGVNLAGAEFFHHKMEGQGKLNKDYYYPTTKELDYWHSRGMDLIRLPFKWERLQRTLNGPMDKEELDTIKSILDQAQQRGMQVLIDMHNYGRRSVNGKAYIIGDEVMPNDFGQFWAAFAREVKGHPALFGYGLCNEPHDMLASTPWKNIAQTAIDSIRLYDTVTPIVVGGNHWSSAERWQKLSNELRELRDPKDNLIFEAHCYFDIDASGIYRKGYDEEHAYPTVGVDRVRPFVEWLKENNFRGLVGEYGIPADDERWMDCLDNFMRYLHENGVGGTYWAAGARWNKYILGVHPTNNYKTDRPQLKVLTRYTETKNEY